MYLIFISSTLLIQFAVKSLSISLLFLMCLINRFTYAVFLKRRKNTLFHQSQNGFLAFTLQSLKPRRSRDFPLSQKKIQSLLKLPLCSIVATRLDLKPFRTIAIQDHTTAVCYFLTSWQTFLVLVYLLGRVSYLCIGVLHLFH